MNKAQAVAAINAAFYYATDPYQESVTGPVARYSVTTYDRVGDLMRRGLVTFYVRDEGLPGEAAFWEGRPPASQTVATFRSDVDAYIAAKIADNTIRAAVVVAMDEARETAVAWAYVTVSANLNEVKVLLRRVGGNITHTLVNTVVNIGG